jgi:hypothetical protein
MKLVLQLTSSFMETKPSPDFEALMSKKKFYLETSMDDGETWEAGGVPFDTKEEASKVLREANHSGADSYVNLRVVER